MSNISLKYLIRQARAPSQYPKRRLFVRSRKASKPRDWYFKLSYRFEIWQAHRQHCCRSACKISERSDNSKYKSRGFETLRDLTERRLFGYWDGAGSCLNIKMVFFVMGISIMVMGPYDDICILKRSSRPVFFLWMSKFLANERRRYIYKVFSHWSRTCSPTVRKRIQICVTLVSLRISSMALTLQFVVRFSLVSQCQIYSFFVYRQFVLLSLLVTNKLALKVSIYLTILSDKLLIGHYRYEFALQLVFLVPSVGSQIS